MMVGPTESMDGFACAMKRERRVIRCSEGSTNVYCESISRPVASRKTHGCEKLLAGANVYMNNIKNSRLPNYKYSLVTGTATRNPRSVEVLLLPRRTRQ